MAQKKTKKDPLKYGSTPKKPKSVKPESGVTRVTPKPIAPKNQKARGRQATENAHKEVTKPKDKPKPKFPGFWTAAKKRAKRRSV